MRSHLSWGCYLRRSNFSGEGRIWFQDRPVRNPNMFLKQPEEERKSILFRQVPADGTPPNCPDKADHAALSAPHGPICVRQHNGWKGHKISCWNPKVIARSTYYPWSWVVGRAQPCSSHTWTTVLFLLSPATPHWTFSSIPFVRHFLGRSHLEGLHMFS